VPKNVIFFVHGVGRHADGWSRIEGGPVHALIEASKQYDCFNGLELDDLVDLVEIRYDDIFDQHLNQWANLASSLKTSPATSATFNKVNGLLADLNSDTNLFAQYGGDVLLYTGFDLIARRVRLRVNSIISNTITTALNAAKNQAGPDPAFSIVGHSLGTTIVHDSMHQLATSNWLPKDEPGISDVSMTEQEKEHINKLMRDPANNPYAPNNFIWDSVFMISNTSRLLSRTDKDPYNSVVQPGQAVRYFVNVEHKLDPVCKFKAFHVPSHWNRRRTLNIEMDHVHDINVHGYAHYLKRPAVHRPLFRNMIPEFGNSCNDQAHALEEAFPKYAGEFDVLQKRAELEAKLNKIIAKSNTESLDKYRAMIEEFGKIIGKFS